MTDKDKEIFDYLTDATARITALQLLFEKGFQKMLVDKGFDMNARLQAELITIKDNLEEAKRIINQETF